MNTQPLYTFINHANGMDDSTLTAYRVDTVTSKDTPFVLVEEENQMGHPTAFSAHFFTTEEDLLRAFVAETKFSLDRIFQKDAYEEVNVDPEEMVRQCTPGHRMLGYPGYRKTIFTQEWNQKPWFLAEGEDDIKGDIAHEVKTHEPIFNCGSFQPQKVFSRSIGPNSFGLDFFRRLNPTDPAPSNKEPS